MCRVPDGPRAFIHKDAARGLPVHQRGYSDHQRSTTEPRNTGEVEVTRDA
jgi:hypothetical protein